MKTQYTQVLANFKQDEVHGGADCPFCGKRSLLESKGSWLVATQNCDHVDMAVDAGNWKTAIAFVRKEK